MARFFLIRSIQIVSKCDGLSGDGEGVKMGRLLVRYQKVKAITQCLYAPVTKFMNISTQLFRIIVS